MRAEALRRAQVWQPPPTPPSRADLKKNPPGAGSFDDDDTIDCRLVVKPLGGTTPKFDCELPGDDVVRVKYGRGNAELHAEVAAARLLSALGFGADRMFVVKKVRCAGCTVSPFEALQCLASKRPEHECFPDAVNYSRRSTFAAAVVERRLEGRRIEAFRDQGWTWDELSRIEPAAGGAPRAHVDALKLMSIVLAHWDNKAENQRLVCPPGEDLPDGGCRRPFAIIQDLGASFGPVKLDLQNWRANPVWTDPRTCRVSMEHLPWEGATFPEGQISEEGRQFLLGLVGELSTGQMTDLFEAARVDQAEGVIEEARRPAAWAAALQEKVAQIRAAGPCPAEAALVR